MSTNSLPDRLGRRLVPLATVVPYTFLGVLTVVTVAVRATNGLSFTLDLVLCGLTGLWIFFMFTLRPAWRERPVLMAVFVAGIIVLNGALVLRDPWFGVFCAIGYVYSFRLIPWPWRLVAVGAVAVEAGVAQASGIPLAGWSGFGIYFGIALANVLPMCALAWIIKIGDDQDIQRRRALAEATEANERLAATLAENEALQHQLVEQARQAGVIDERQRMAREIHDTLAQGLTGIITQLQAAEQAGDDPAEWRRHVSAATSLARESLADARRSVHALRPQPLETARLGEALSDVARRWSSLHGVPVRVTTTGDARPMRADAEFVLLRTAQEALANVAKHARAGRVGVTLSYLEHEVALDVRDDGRGFDATDMPIGDHGGFGLVAMRQRVEGLSGTLQIESEPGGGTGISARIPVEAAA
jgi:signal transduction histidine kinase